MLSYTDEYLFDASSAVLGLQGLACLAASSKAFRNASLAVAQQDAHILLQQTLTAADGLKNQTQQQHLQAVAWLLKALPKHTCNSTPAVAKAAAAVTRILAASQAEGLIRLPAVPLAWAKRLVAAGVRVTWAQLLEAAGSNVLGVEVWGQALDQLLMPTDFPLAAFALFRGGDWLRLAGHNLLGLLQLELNSTVIKMQGIYLTPAGWALKPMIPSVGTATKSTQATLRAVRRLPAVLEPATARRLITTAVLRQHAAVRDLLSCPAILEHVDGPTLAAVLRHEPNGVLGAWPLQQSPAFEQLVRGGGVLQLLQEAVQQGNVTLARNLLPAAQLLTTADIRSLLHAPAPSFFKTQLTVQQHCHAYGGLRACS